MGGLTSSLLNATSSLMAQQAGIETAGRNLANVNNPNYARQRVIYGDRATLESGLGNLGTGVEALGIQQMRSSLLDTQVTREISSTQYLQSQQDAFQQAQGDLNENIDSSGDTSSITDSTQSTNGISAGLNDFFSSFDQVASNPSDTGAKQVLLQQADLLVNKFNTVDSRLSQVQTDLTTQIGSDVTSVNTLLKNIANLNGEIQKAEINAPNSSADLNDQRQADLEQLAQYMNFSTQAIAGTAGEIQVTAKDTNGNDVVLVDKTAVTGALNFSGSTFTGGGTNSALAITGGSLAGNLTARDNGIQSLRNSLKTTASQLTTAVNSAYNPTSSTGNFFATNPSTGLLQLDPSLNVNTLKTTDTGNAGANELALAVAGVAQKSFSTTSGDLITGTIGAYYNQTVTGFGKTLSTVSSELTDQQSVQTMITGQRDSVSGVSTDEEVTDLMKYQRAYQASAKVISVIDSMMDTLVNGLGL